MHIREEQEEEEEEESIIKMEAQNIEIKASTLHCHVNKLKIMMQPTKQQVNMIQFLT